MHSLDVLVCLVVHARGGADQDQHEGDQAQLHHACTTTTIKACR